MVTSHSVLLVEPNLYRMDHATVQHSASTLQLRAAVHNFDSSRLHIECKPDGAGCAGLPSAGAQWSVVLIFNTMEQCVGARQKLEQARLELLQRRREGVGQALGETAAGPLGAATAHLPPATATTGA
jgi:hypothetical protein